MRYLLLVILALFLLPCVAAATTPTAGWYYTGDTFKIGDVVYSVEGSDYARVLLGVGGKLYVINEGECREEGLNKYCYLESAYPADTKHIKYAAGHEYYGYHLSISVLSPTITVTRSVSKNNPRLGDTVTVRVNFSNTGNYAVNYLLYNESIPVGFSIVGDPQRNVVYQRKTLSPGDIDTFSYTLVAEDYVNTNMLPNITYYYETTRYNLSVASISLFVDTPLLLTRTVTSSLNLGDTGIYQVNISNKDNELPMKAAVVVRFPKELYPIEITGFNRSDNITYNASFTLASGKNTSLRITFGTSYGGTFRIPVNVTATVGDTVFRRYYEDAVTAKADRLVPTIKLSTGRTVFKPGEQLTISAMLMNTNTKTTFESINGALVAPGLFEDKTFSHAAFPPGRNLTEVEVVAITPVVENTTKYNITFRGKYVTPGGEWYNFEESKQFTVEPLREYVAFTRTVVPTTATPGGNITVTVATKNIYNEYVTFSAHEAYDPALDRISGITFADVSLERDQKKDLYIYQLQVPMNYTTNINLTTNILVKGETMPLKFSTIVPVTGAPPAVEQNASVNVTTNTTQGTPTGDEGAGGKKKLGFFAAIWDFFKNLF